MELSEPPSVDDAWLHALPVQVQTMLMHADWDGVDFQPQQSWSELQDVSTLRQSSQSPFMHVSVSQQSSALAHISAPPAHKPLSPPSAPSESLDEQAMIVDAARDPMSHIA